MGYIWDFVSTPNITPRHTNLFEVVDGDRESRQRGKRLGGGAPVKGLTEGDGDVEGVLDGALREQPALGGAHKRDGRKVTCRPSRRVPRAYHRVHPTYK